MTYAALLLAILVGVAVSWFRWEYLGRFERIETALRALEVPAYDDTEVREALSNHRAHIEELTDAVADLEQGQRDQTVAIAEGIERVDRSERRVRSAVARARKRMADLGYEDEGLEAEAEGLRLIDGDGGQGNGMQPMREGVGGAGAGHPGPDRSAFPGRW